MSKEVPNLLDYFRTHSILRSLEKNAYYSDLITDNTYSNSDIAIDEVDNIIRQFVYKDLIVDKIAVYYNEGYHLFLKVYSNDCLGWVDYFYVYTNNTTLHLLSSDPEDNIYIVLDIDLDGTNLDLEKIKEKSPLAAALDESKEAEEFLDNTLQKNITFNNVLQNVEHFKEVSFKKYISLLKHYSKSDEYIRSLAPIKKRYMFKLFEDNKSSLFHDWSKGKAVRKPVEEGVTEHDLVVYKIRNFEEPSDEENFEVMVCPNNTYVLKNHIFNKNNPKFLIGESITPLNTTNVSVLKQESKNQLNNAKNKAKGFYNRFKDLRIKFREEQADFKAEKVDEVLPPEVGLLLDDIFSYFLTIASFSFAGVMLGPLSGLAAAIIVWASNKFIISKAGREDTIDLYNNKLERLNKEIRNADSKTAKQNAERFKRKIERRIETIENHQTPVEKVVEKTISKLPQYEDEMISETAQTANKITDIKSFKGESKTFSESLKETKTRQIIDPLEVIQKRKKLLKESFVGVDNKHVKKQIRDVFNKFNRISSSYTRKDIINNKDKFNNEVQEVYQEMYSVLGPYIINPEVDLFSEGIDLSIGISKLKRKAKRVPKDIIEKLIKFRRKAQSLLEEYSNVITKEWADYRKEKRDKMREKVINDEVIPFLDEVVEWFGTAVITGAGYVVAGLILGPVATLIATVAIGIATKTVLKERKRKRRKAAIKILEHEIEMVEEKIQDARNRNDIKNRDTLKRFKHKLERKVKEIKIENRLK